MPFERKRNKINRMKRLLGCTVLGLVTVMAYAQMGSTMSDTPAFHARAPKGALPPVLKGSQLTGPEFTRPFQVTAYQMAAKIEPVIYQQPCYCRCDRAMGHTSLHSCAEGTHGAECSTCLKEFVYSYQETKRGRTAAQIRAGIERGEWENIDLEKAAL